MSNSASLAERGLRIHLALLLSQIESHDTDDEARYPLVLDAVAMALKAGLSAGIRVDPAEPEWPVAFIELPCGQVSWQLPQHPFSWDGHSTAQKYGRCRHFICERGLR